MAFRITDIVRKLTYRAWPHYYSAMPVVECEPEMKLREDKSVDFCFP
jgi:hypothetical protein